MQDYQVKEVLAAILTMIFKYSYVSIWMTWLVTQREGGTDLDRLPGIFPSQHFLCFYAKVGLYDYL